MPVKLLCRQTCCRCSAITVMTTADLGRRSREGVKDRDSSIWSYQVDGKTHSTCDDGVGLGQSIAFRCGCSTAAGHLEAQCWQQGRVSQNFRQGRVSMKFSDKAQFFGEPRAIQHFLQYV